MAEKKQASAEQPNFATHRDVDQAIDKALRDLQPQADQDLKNGIGSALEFVAEGFRMLGHEDVRQYLLDIVKKIEDGEGMPAPNPGPVTPVEVAEDGSIPAR